MLRMCTLALLTATLGGCAARATVYKSPTEWPEPDATPLVAPSMEAGAALAAAAAIREMIRQNPYPNLFRGCSSPEQGLNVEVFKDPKTGLYYVLLDQRFDRCGGPSGRVLDFWYEYAVTPQGEVLGRAPPMAAEPAPVSPPASPPPPTEQVPPSTDTPSTPTPQLPRPSPSEQVPPPEAGPAGTETPSSSPTPASPRETNAPPPTPSPAAAPTPAPRG
jgi:hypothetical protein